MRELNITLDVSKRIKAFHEITMINPGDFVKNQLLWLITRASNFYTASGKREFNWDLADKLFPKIKPETKNGHVSKIIMSRQHLLVLNELLDEIASFCMMDLASFYFHRIKRILDEPPDILKSDLKTRYKTTRISETRKLAELQKHTGLSHPKLVNFVVSYYIYNGGYKDLLQSGKTGKKFATIRLNVPNLRLTLATLSDQIIVDARKAERLAVVWVDLFDRYTRIETFMDNAIRHLHDRLLRKEDQ